MHQSNSAQKTDRRNYFRIDDVTILYHRVISDNEASAQGYSDQLSIDKLTLKARFETLSREMKPMSMTVRENNPTLARYLAAIDQKLNMLSEILMNNAVDELDEKPQKVNISAGGLSFLSESPITSGSILELRFILQPTNIGIYSHAKVVACSKLGENKEENKTYKVAVEFVRMNDEFRDQISKHVLERERAILASNLELDN